MLPAKQSTSFFRFKILTKISKENAISVRKVDITGVSAEYVNATRQTGGTKMEIKSNRKSHSHPSPTTMIGHSECVFRSSTFVTFNKKEIVRNIIFHFLKNDVSNYKNDFS